MIGGGKIDVRTIDGDLYINMWQLSQHLLISAYAIKDMPNLENANVVAETLAELTATIAELAIYTLEKAEIDNVDDMVRKWSGE